MKSRLWLNLILLIFVIALIAMVILKPGVDTSNKTPSLTSLKIDDIKHVLIQRKHGKDIELEKQNHRWWMSQPVSMPADSFKVNALLNLVETPVYSQYDLTKLEPARYRLDAPRASITLNHQLKINFGSSEPLHKRRYLSIENNLYTANDLFYHQLASDITRYLDPALLPANSKIKKLILPKLTLEKIDGSWQRQPENDAMSADADMELIDAWQNSAALNISVYSDFKQLDKNIIIVLEASTTPLSFNYLYADSTHYLTRIDNGIRYTLSDDIAIQLAMYQQPDNDAQTPVEAEEK